MGQDIIVGPDTGVKDELGITDAVDLAVRQRILFPTTTLVPRLFSFLFFFCFVLIALFRALVGRKAACLLRRRN